MPLTIRRVAEETGLSPKAIRLYEARGLIPTVDRTEGGYRTYADHDIAVLRFISQARALGLELVDIKQILDLQRAGAQPCATVVELLDERIREIDNTISSLRQLRGTLLRARNSASETRHRGEEVVVCQLIESQPTGSAPSQPRRRRQP